MGKYEPLGQFLRRQGRQEVPLTFREIEEITGVKLPPKAQHHRAWWSNNPSNNVMTRVWLSAGYESTQVDMEAAKLVFRRVAEIAGGRTVRADSRIVICNERRSSSGIRRAQGHHICASRRRPDRTR
jgi:hypothetical protein